MLEQETKQERNKRRSEQEIQGDKGSKRNESVIEDMVLQCKGECARERVRLEKKILFK